MRNLIARLKAAPPWVWITIAIAAAGLVISFLIYRNSQSGSATTGSVNPGDTTGGYSPYGNNGPATGDSNSSTNDLLQQIINLLNQMKAPPMQPPPVPPAPGPVPATNPGGGHPVFGPPIAPPPGGPVSVTAGQNPASAYGSFTPGGVPVRPGSVQIYQSSGRPGAGAGQPQVTGSLHHSDHLTGSLPHPGALVFGVPHPGMLN